MALTHEIEQLEVDEHVVEEKEGLLTHEPLETSLQPLSHLFDLRRVIVAAEIREEPL